jgi:WD40 repeat protein/serine/threonine protein kinase
LGGLDSKRSTVPEGDLPPDVRDALANPSMRLDRYVLVKELGRGAMGAVFRAYDLTIRRYVAIKVLLQTGSLREEELHRFRREATAAGKLHHPGIVQVHDLGKHQGRPFIVMELVDGEGLDAILKRGPLDRARAIAVVHDVALALAHAHGQGVTHRDVKPANVLVDREGRLRLTDFGVARDLLSSSGGTRTGELVGTPLYMSPEQAVGDTKWHGPHTDVYALGALLHRVIAGIEPFADSASLPALIARVRREAPPALGSGSDALDGLAERCLAKDPAARPTAADVAKALEEHRAPATVATPPPDVPRDPSPVAAIAGVVVLALGVAGAITFAAWPKEPAPPSAPAPSSATPSPPPVAAAPPPGPPKRDVPAIPDLCQGFLASEKKKMKLVSVWGSYEWKKSGMTGSIAFTPDGRRLVTSGWEALVVWDSETGRELRVLRADNRRSASCALTGDGKRAIEGLSDGSVVLHDLESARPEPVLVGKHDERALGVAIAKDGARAVSSGPDGKLKVWRLRDRSSTLVREIEGIKSWCLPVAISTDGHQGASGRQDGSIQLWDLESGTLVRTFVGHQNVVSGVALSADGRRLLSCSEDGTLRVWDARTGEPLFTSPAYWGRNLAIALAPDGRTALASVWSRGNDFAPRLWDLEGFAEVGKLEGPEWFATSLCFSPDGSRAASAGQDSAIRVWDVATRKDVRSLPPGHGDGVSAVAFSPDGKLVLTGSVDHTVRLWEVATGRELRTFTGHGAIVTSLAWHRDGRRFVSSSGDGTLRVWETDGGRVRVLRAGGAGCAWARWVDDGRGIVSADRDGAVRSWDVESGKELATKGQRAPLRSLAVSSDDRLAITTCEDQSVVIWGLAKGGGLEPLSTLDVSASKDAAHVAFAGGNKTVVTTHLDGSIQFHDLEQGTSRRVAAHRAGEDWLVITVAASPDGRRAVTAGATDRKVILWDVATASPIDQLDLASSTDHISSLEFAPDGKGFVAGTARGVVMRFALEERR